MEPKFKVSQRVLYTSPQIPDIPTWEHRASMGNEGYMPLNRRDENGVTIPITGTILGIVRDNNGDIDYNFAPDGWILPITGWPHGFQAPEKHFSELSDPDLYLPGIVER